MAFKPSPFQMDVFRCVRDGTGSLIIEAVAGSGKTTTIVGTVKLLSTNQRIMFNAFNKAIADELGTKLPSHVNCCTMNGLGHRAWMRHIDDKLKLNKKKTYDILDSSLITGVYGKAAIRSVRYPVKQLVGYAKSSGIVPRNLEGSLKGLVKDTDDAWMVIINHHNVDMNVKREDKSRAEINNEIRERTLLAIEVSRKVLEIGIKMQTEIDFDDQMYMPVIHSTRFIQNHYVFVDEAQDISAIQRIMLKRSLRSDGRLIAVGDPAQAIYGFRGSDSESLSNIGKMFNAQSLPLSISYRCPKAVVREAQKFVSHIESHVNAPEGTVEWLGTYNPDDLDIFQPDDFVLCRNVAPLVKLAFALIRQNKPVGILGRNIGQNIAKLITKLEAVDILDLRNKLHEWQNAEIERMQESDPEAKCGWVIEQASAVRSFIDCSGASTIKGVLDSIDKLFNDKIEGAIKLATIHKSKGLEAKRVLILDRGLIPSRYATQDWQLEQENNLMYVAITRSMDYLGFINSPDEENEL